MQSCGSLKTAVTACRDGILVVIRLECIGALLHASRGIVVRGFCELWILSWSTATRTTHTRAANRVRCRKFGVKCSCCGGGGVYSYSADTIEGPRAPGALLTRVFTTSTQVFPLAPSPTPSPTDPARRPSDSWPSPDTPPSQKGWHFGCAKHPGATYTVLSPFLRVRHTSAAKRRPGTTGERQENVLHQNTVVRQQKSGANRHTETVISRLLRRHCACALNYTITYYVLGACRTAYHCGQVAFRSAKKWRFAPFCP